MGSRHSSGSGYRRVDCKVWGGGCCTKESVFCSGSYTEESQDVKEGRKYAVSSLSG